MKGGGWFSWSIAEEGVEVHLTLEEAEALASVAKPAVVKDKRSKALMEQALDQIAVVCRQVRERVRLGDTFIDPGTRSIPRTIPRGSPALEGGPAEEETAPAPPLRYRPLGDPDNLSLKEVGEILGKARDTIYLWYRQRKFPPAVDVALHLHESKPVIVVPRYRLEAWQAGERMPAILQDVFESHGLREPPWTCLTIRKGASREDIAFWVERRGLQPGLGTGGKRIYGRDIEEGNIYELFPLGPAPAS